MRITLIFHNFIIFWDICYFSFKSTSSSSYILYEETYQSLHQIILFMVYVFGPIFKKKILDTCRYLVEFWARILELNSQLCNLRGQGFEGALLDFHRGHGLVLRG